MVNEFNLDLDQLGEELAGRSWAILDEVLSKHLLDALREEALQDYEAGAFHRAAVGKGVEKQRIQEVRSDRVAWWQREEATEVQSEYWFYVDVLRQFLSQFFRVHLERTELHFAVYLEGAFYAPHVDQFREQADRIFSIITYLNPDWQEGDGGELRIHDEDGGYIDVAPLHGRTVIFRSDTVLHEVLTANKPRVSVTGWMRRDPFIY